MTSSTRRPASTPSASRPPSTARNVPESVYRTLIAEANTALPTLHRAFRLRARLLGIPDLAYHDIYPPLVPSTSKCAFPDREGREASSSTRPCAARAGVRRRRGEGLLRALDRRLPAAGQALGRVLPRARCTTSTRTCCSTTATTTRASPRWPTSGVTRCTRTWPTRRSRTPRPTTRLFVAEVASTFNEALLLDRMLERREDRRRAPVPARQLPRGCPRHVLPPDDVRRVRARHPRGRGARRGAHRRAALEDLRRPPAALPRSRRRGASASTTRTPSSGPTSPTSTTTSTSTSTPPRWPPQRSSPSEVLDGKPGARERYLGLLKAGGSRYPYELLKEAGVDLATPTPYRALAAQMNSVMDEIEKIVATK